MLDFPAEEPSEAYRIGLEVIMSNAREQKSQLDKFKEAARELGTDDDEQRFKERLGRVVRYAPTDKQPKED